jgi:protocatechuate 3,4-dioxygenase beta subunit
MADSTSGARVLVTQQSMPGGIERGGAVVVSGPKGAYELCVPTGFLQMEINADGYGGIITNGWVHARTRRDFTLIPEAIIVGKVVHDEDGSPVAGASVGAWPASWGRIHSAPRMTTADANGRFRITGVAAGRHRLQPVGDELYPTTPVEVVVEAGQTSREMVLRMGRTRHVSGTVVERGTSKPVAGAEVNIWSRNGRGGGTTSQSDGSFVVSVPSGTFDVRVMPWDVISPKSITVGDGDVTGVRIEVEQLASVRGRITYKGEAVAGAIAQLSGTGGPHQAASDADGRYEIRGLPPGTYHIFATSARHEAFGEAHPDHFPVAAREHLDGKDIELNFAGSIAGVVVDQKGAPVPGVWVSFDLIGGSDGGGSGTGLDGSFTATQMTGGGDYRPSVMPTDASPVRYPPASGEKLFPPVALADGATHIEGVRLQIRYDRMSISGRVTDAAGKPQPDVRVLAAAQEGNQLALFFLWQDLPAATTAVDGSFTLTELQQANYSLQARAADGNTAIVRDVPAGKSGVSIILTGTGGIDGEVVGFRGSPDITAFRIDQPTQEMLNPLLDGSHFQLRGLAPGRYRVNASAPDGGDAQIVAVQAGVNAAVTLRSHGIGSISGRVVDWRTGTAAPGMECNANVTSGTEAWGGPGPSGTADAQGAFEIASAPAGSIRVGCFAGGGLYSDGRTRLTLAQGGHADVEIPVVKRQLPRVTATIQANFDMTSDAPRIGQVIPGGAADKAGVKSGDLIVAVDGLAVDKLSAWGVMVFITDRAIGSTARLSLLRAGQPVSANVVVASEF